MPLAHRIEFGRGMIGWVAEHGQYLLANDVRKEPRFFAAHMTATLSELVVPVRLGGDVVASPASPRPPAWARSPC
jgi:putative methionine-R-sulfoxide reductase with GAF domain